MGIFVDAKKLLSGINKINNFTADINEVFDLTMKDMIKRAPGPMATAITNHYGIKKSEVRYKKDFNHGKKKIGSIYVRGEDISSIEFKFSGRVLTPLHFGMTPKERPQKKKYKIYAKIKKKKKAFETVPTQDPNNGIFLAPASKSSTIIPWFRYSADKKDIKPIKTLSLPQMVDNKGVRREINEKVADLMHKRFDHHLARFIKKSL